MKLDDLERNASSLAGMVIVAVVVMFGLMANCVITQSHDSEETIRACIAAGGTNTYVTHCDMHK